MKLNEIEGLSASELKAKRAELVEAAKSAEVGELAARYVQARTDATIRDEKMSEQGKTIALLQEAAAAAKTREDKLAKELASARSELAAAVRERDDLRGAVRDECEKATRGVALARSRRKALADISGIIAPLLADEG